METQRTQLVQEKQAAEAQHDEYSRLLKSYMLQASQTGIVHLNAAISPGMTLQSGTVIGTISTNSVDDLELGAYIQAQDRSKVRIGDSVEIAVSGVSKNDYGGLKGKITGIDTDAAVNQDKGTVTFKIVIKPDATELTDKQGNRIALMSGMVAEVHIIYEDTTWLNWILEQIGI